MDTCIGQDRTGLEKRDWPKNCFFAKWSGKGLPEATHSICSTKSWPLTNSVIGCSTSERENKKEMEERRKEGVKEGRGGRKVRERRESKKEIGWKWHRWRDYMEGREEKKVNERKDCDMDDDCNNWPTSEFLPNKCLSWC